MTTPRWLRLFAENLAANEAPTYTLATIELNGSSIHPRSRSVIHRQVLTISPKKPLFVTTTDIRTPKANQLITNSSSEATFWFNESQQQFRITAKAYLLPHLTHPWRSSFPSDMLSDGQEFDWEEFRLSTFDSLSRYLRASFVRPVPGTPMESYDEANSWPQKLPKRHEAEGEEKRIIEEALRNFAVVVLDPTHVDLVELGIFPNRRTAWSLITPDETWKERILVP